jgi:cystathionine beta-lyase family protein involved in aluminum resistance
MFEYDFLSVVMYPDLKNRRHYVHYAWLIAKFTENFELKMAISNDPYFFITRDDIFQLIKTQDDVMIEHMLKIQVALQIQEDISYKLVAIKHA